METILTGFAKEDFRAFLKDVINDVLAEKGYEIRERSELMDIDEVSKLLNMKVKTVYAKTSQRIIPHYKRGRKLVFKRAEILAWLDGGRVATIREIQKEIATRLNVGSKN